MMRSAVRAIVPLMIAVILAALSVSAIAAANVQISGTVSNQSGFGIASVTVAVLDGSNNSVASTTTDASGHYSLSVPSGTYTLQATPPAGDNYQTATKTNQSVTADTIVDFTLAPVTNTIALTGRLLDEAGSGIPNQQLSLGGQQISTDASGRYAFQVVPGTYSLSGGQSSLIPQPDVPPEYGFTISPLTLSQDTALDIPLPLKRVTVHVQDANGAPVAGTRVDAFGGPFGGETIHTNIGALPFAVTTVAYRNLPPTILTTNAAGDAPLWLFQTPPPAGALTFGYQITATPPAGSVYAATTISNVAVTADSTVTITLLRPVTLSGRLLDEAGSGIPTQQLSLGGQSVATDANGHYAFQVVPGTYTLSGGEATLSLPPDIPPQYGFTIGPLALSQDTALDIPLPLKHVTVHVQDANGAPVAGARVDAFGGPFGGETVQTSIGALPFAVTIASYPNLPPNILTTNAAGDASLALFQTPPPSTISANYRLTATPPAGSVYAATTVSNVEVSSDTTVTITLIRPVTLSGRLLDEAGSGIPSQHLSLGGQSVATDANGRYAFQVVPGTYSLSGGQSSLIPQPDVPPEYGFTISPLTLSQDTALDIPLPLKRVTVHVQDANGAPVAGTRVDAFGGPFGGETIHTNIGALPFAVTTVAYRNLPPTILTTNAAGDAPLWLFQTPPPSAFSANYRITATPPAGSNYPVTSLTNVPITADTTVIIVLQVTVVTGTTTGGTPATFAGTGFQPGTQVSFGGVPATSVSVLTTSSATTAASTAAASTVTKLVAVAPAHSPGKVDVTIVNPDGQSLTISGGYVYAAVASIQVTGAPVPGTTFKVGQTAHLHATGTFTDGKTADVTGQVRWSTDGSGVAYVDAAGVVTGAAPGTATITGTLGSAPPVQITVTVGTPTPVGISAPHAPAGRAGGAGVTPAGGPVAPAPLPSVPPASGMTGGPAPAPLPIPRQ